MAMDAVVQVRLDTALKGEAEAYFSAQGTSLASAVRRFLKSSVEGKLVEEETLPAKVTAEESLHGFGCLSYIADPAKRGCEKDAWARAMQEKHHT